MRDKTSRTQKRPAREKRSWERFRCAYIEGGFFDDTRSKTLEAMRALCHNLPPGELEKLPPQVIVFAPASSFLGEVYPLSESGLEQEGILIYLAPMLESKSQEEVNFTVAHEFAHAVLHRFDGEARDSGIEAEADALAEKWGFRKPPN